MRPRTLRPPSCDAAAAAGACIRCRCIMTMMAAPLLAATAALLVSRSAATCTLDGRWTYAPELGHDYTWKVDSQGNLACFAGRDWGAASGKLAGSNLSLTFGDPKVKNSSTSCYHLSTLPSSLYAVADPPCVACAANRSARLANLQAAARSMCRNGGRWTPIAILW